MISLHDLCVFSSLLCCPRCTCGAQRAVFPRVGSMLGSKARHVLSHLSCPGHSFRGHRELLGGSWSCKLHGSCCLERCHLPSAVSIALWNFRISDHLIELFSLQALSPLEMFDVDKAVERELCFLRQPRCLGAAPSRAPDPRILCSQLNSVRCFWL